MPKFIATSKNDRQKQLHPFLNTPQKKQNETPKNGLIDNNNQEKESNPLKMFKRLFRWFSKEDSKPNSSLEQSLTISYPIDQELDRIVLPPLDLPLNPNSVNLVVASPRLPPAERPSISYSEEDFTCFPFHEFDPKHPILGEHYESPDEVTHFFRNISPFDYEVVKSVRDNLLKKSIWTPAYLVYQNRRIMYSARLLAITTYFNYENFPFYEYNYDYTTNTATIIPPDFTKSPLNNKQYTISEQKSALLELIKPDYQLIGQQIQDNSIQSDPLEKKWLADLTKYFADKKAAAKSLKDAQTSIKSLNEVKPATIPATTVKSSITGKPSTIDQSKSSKSENIFAPKVTQPEISISPAPATNPTTFSTTFSTTELTSGSSSKKRSLASSEEQPSKISSFFNFSSKPLANETQTETTDQPITSKNKRSFNDSEASESSSTETGSFFTKKLNTNDTKNTKDDIEKTDLNDSAPDNTSVTSDSTKLSSNLTTNSISSKPFGSFFGSKSNDQTSTPTPAFSFASNSVLDQKSDIGKGSLFNSKNSTPYSSSIQMTSKINSKDISNDDETEKESHLEKSELSSIPSLPFGLTASSDKPNIFANSSKETPKTTPAFTFGSLPKLDAAPISQDNKPTETDSNPTSIQLSTDKEDLKPNNDTPVKSPFTFGISSLSTQDNKSQNQAPQTRNGDSSEKSEENQINNTITSTVKNQDLSTAQSKENPTSSSLFQTTTTVDLKTDSTEAKANVSTQPSGSFNFKFGASSSENTAQDSTKDTTQSTSLFKPQVPLSTPPTSNPFAPKPKDSESSDTPAAVAPKLPSISPSSPMSITPMQVTPDTSGSMQISPPRPPISPTFSSKTLTNPFQSSTTTSNPFGSTNASTAPQNPFGNSNSSSNQLSNSNPFANNKFAQNKPMNSGFRPKSQPFGSAKPAQDIFASSNTNNSFAISPLSTNVMNNSGGFQPGNSFGNFNNNANPTPGFSSNTFNSFGSNTNAPNPFASTNNFGSNNSFGSGGFGANNNLNPNAGSGGFGSNNNANSNAGFGASNPVNSGFQSNFGSNSFNTNNSMNTNSGFGSGMASSNPFAQSNAQANPFANNFGFSSRTNSVHSGASSGPNSSVNSRDSSPSNTTPAHLRDRVIAKPRSRRG